MDLKGENEKPEWTAVFAELETLKQPFTTPFSCYACELVSQIQPHINHCKWFKYWYVTLTLCTVPRSFRQAELHLLESAHPHPALWLQAIAVHILVFLD